MPVNTKIQLRRGTASSWTSTNPTLAAGEIGFESDTGLFKVGDGTTSWSSLDYAALPFNGVDDKPYFGSGVFQSLTQGSGVSLTYNNSTGKTTISLSDPTIQVADVTDFVDGVNDRVADLLTQGSNVQLTYTDSGNDNSTLQIAVTGVALSNHTHTLSAITDVTASATEVNYLDGSLPGTGVASKAVVLDANRNITGIGQITTTGNIIVGNDLIVNGNTVTVNSTTVTIDDPIFTLGGDTVPGSDDNKDRGIEFRYHNGTSAKLGFFGYDDSTGKFTFIPDATNTSEVFSGTKGEVDANVDCANILNKPDPVITGILTGDVTGTGTVTLTDLANGTLSIAATIAANSVALGTDTTGNYVASITNGTYITGANGGSEGAALTLDVNASTSGASNIVARDSSGNFSAGTITATFSGNGASITSINADNISTGTLSSSRLPSVTQSNTTAGPASTFVTSVSVDTYGRVTGLNTTSHALATTGIKGIASFDSGDFAVNTGVVTIKAGGVDNNQLANSSFTIGQTALSLGSTYNAISGVSAANPVTLTYFVIDGGTP
jgi:hypothetical protein